ncbi:hypothetical protein [Legionella sp. W05-934-2]|jgi:hypothetical protein|uniref:nuclear transport factor 2 family protein n=1 Tax=Legionella sp. W05-934-2 TaxID=1198649 RepID=UPI003462A14C
MNKLTKSTFATLILLGSHLAQAYAEPQSLDEKRQAVVAKYVNNLAQADLEGMQAIFSGDATVVSTSAGEKNALSFFAGFFPLIQSAHTQLHQRFVSVTDTNRLAARFHLDYQLYDGETGNGEYVDEFVFYDNSEQLKAVYMFENLKFPQ